MAITWLRTPETQFSMLDGYPFAANYVNVPFEGQFFRLHYVDAGPPLAEWSGETILLLHGQPSWSYLYRKVIPLLVAAGHRVVAPDLPGFGKSDKPSLADDITYARQEQWLRTALFDLLDLKDLTVFMQDWGGLIGLRLVAFEPERFSRVVVANTGLPVGGKDSNFLPDDAPRMALAYIGARIWQMVARRLTPGMIGWMAGKLCRHVRLSDAEKAAYRAPFPDKRYLAGPRGMPQQIPLDPKSVASQRNREAWHRLKSFRKPFLTAFSDLDDAGRMLPVDRHFQQNVPGAAGQRHRTITSAGHFLQEDQPEQVAAAILDIINDNPAERG